MQTLKKYSPFFLRVAFIGFLFILLSVVMLWYAHTWHADKHYYRFLYVTILSFGGALWIYHAVQAVVFILLLKDDPSPALQRFHTLGIGGIAAQMYQARVSQRQKVLLSYSVWGIAIIIFVHILNVNGVYGGAEDVFLVNQRVRDIYRGHVTHRFPKANKFVEVLPFYTEENNPVRYLQDMNTICADLRAAGAKTIIVELPGQVFPMTRRRVDRLDSLLERLQGMRPVVFAGSFWYYQNPISHNNLSPITIRRMDSYHVFSSSLVRYTPYRYTSDIILSSAKRYFDLPDSLQPVRTGEEIVLGPIRVPVSRNGEAFCDNMEFLNGGMATYVAYRGFQDSADPAKDPILYTSDPGTIGVHDATRKQPESDLLHSEGIFRGKIVLVRWNFSEAMTVMNTLSIVGALESIVEGGNYNHASLSVTIVTILSVFFIGMISFRSGAFVTFVWGTLLVLACFGGSLWAFLSLRTIMEFLYPVTAIGVAVIVFPLLRTTFRIGEQGRIPQ